MGWRRQSRNKGTCFFIWLIPVWSLAPHAFLSIAEKAWGKNMQNGGWARWPTERKLATNPPIDIDHKEEHGLPSRQPLIGCKIISHPYNTRPPQTSLAVRKTDSNIGKKHFEIMKEHGKAVQKSTTSVRYQFCRPNCNLLYNVSAREYKVKLS